MRAPPPRRRAYTLPKTIPMKSIQTNLFRHAGIPAAVLLLTAIIQPASAATILPVGSVQGENDWFTAGYGSAGYVFFGSGASTPVRGGALNATNGSISVTQNAALGGSAVYPALSQALELPTGGTFTAGVWYTAGLTNDNLSNIATFTFGAGSPDSVRIGVLVGATSMASGMPADFPGTVAINGVSQLVLQPATEMTSADWYFFDVTGITAGDTFTIQSSRIADVANHRFNPVSGVVFAAVPEPSAFLFAAMGGFLCLGRRRRAD